MLVCNVCGELKQASELRYVTEPHGERHLNRVCHCGGDLVEATKCAICGEWFDNTELHGVCEACLEEYETVGNALEIGEAHKVDVPVNEFIANVLSAEQIDKILTKWVEENFTDRSRPVVDYCEDDKSWFSDFVKEKVGE